MRTGSVIVIPLFMAFLLAVVIWLANQRGPQEVLEASATWSQLRQAVGLYIAGFAALALLVKGLEVETGGRAVPFIAAVLAGVLLMDPNWGVGLGLGVLGAALALRGCLPVPHRRLPSVAPPAEPRVL